MPDEALTTGTPRGALAGVRVIDLSSVMMGPATTQTLADMGASVIKVESADGDIMRRPGPSRNSDMGSIFLQANRGKRSLVLDLKREEGRECFLRILETTDVLVTNIRPLAMARLGLKYEDVAAANPKIVYTSLVGYGQSGPYAARPAYDDLIQALVALPTLAYLAGSDRPRYVPLAIADRYVASVAVGAILGALFHCAKTGEGQHLEVPMFETMAQLVLSDHIGGRTFEPPLGPTGYKRVLSAARFPYPTSDGHIGVLAYTDRQWRSFFKVIGRADLLEDERFADMASRTQHIDELYLLMGESMRSRTSREWLQMLNDADIPSMPLNTVDSLLDDPHLAAVGFIKSVEHPTEGPLRCIGVPTTWSRTPAMPGSPAPRIGQHSLEVLREAGYADGEIRALIAKGITQDGPVEVSSRPSLNE